MYLHCGVGAIVTRCGIDRSAAAPTANGVTPRVRRRHTRRCRRCRVRRSDYRQVSFVALAALALVLTAALAPGLTGGESDSSPGADVDWDGIVPDIDFNPDTDVDGSDDGGNADGEPGDGPGGGFDWRRLLEWLNLDRNDDVEPPTKTDGKPQCVIMLDREPVPGSRLTATIRYEGEPLTETPVWFDERRVGETDDAGRVTGEVPYVEELVIRVGTATDATCRAGTATSLPSSTTSGSAGYHSDDARQSSADVRGLGSPEPGIGAVPSVRRDVPTAAATVSTASVTSSASSTLALASSATPAASVQEESPGNATGSYAVDGAVTIDVDGEPYPGETITIDAAVEDVPMREATVSVDGTAVGETDGSGRATVRVPDDGTDTFEIGVARRLRGDDDGRCPVARGGVCSRRHRADPRQSRGRRSDDQRRTSRGCHGNRRRREGGGDGRRRSAGDRIAARSDRDGDGQHGTPDRQRLARRCLRRVRTRALEYHPRTDGALLSPRRPTRADGRPRRNGGSRRGTRRRGVLWAVGRDRRPRRRLSARARRRPVAVRAGIASLSVRDCSSPRDWLARLLSRLVALGWDSSTDSRSSSSGCTRWPGPSTSGSDRCRGPVGGCGYVSRPGSERCRDASGPGSRRRSRPPERCRCGRSRRESGRSR